MIIRLWKLNVSTVLILPLFNNLTKDLLLKSKPISFIQLCFLYGLEKTYLTQDFNNLVLVFPKLKTANKLLNSNYSFWSFNEYMLNLKSYNKFEIYNDYILFYLNIDDLYRRDIVKITNSKYSEVSNIYKENLDISKYFKSLCRAEEISDYICHNNIPRSIVSKENFMKSIIESYLKVNVPSENEYFKLFDHSIEIFTPTVLYS